MWPPITIFRMHSMGRFHIQSVYSGIHHADSMDIANESLQPGQTEVSTANFQENPHTDL